MTHESPGCRPGFAREPAVSRPVRIRMGGVCLRCATLLCGAACGSDPPPHPEIHVESCDSGDEVAARDEAPRIQDDAAPWVQDDAAPWVQDEPPPEETSPEETSPEEAARNRRNLERAKSKLHDAYENFKDALGPAADYVSAKTREAYEKGKKALNEAIEAVRAEQQTPADAGPAP